MEIDKIFEALFILPLDPRSPYDVVKEMGCYEVIDKLSVEAICKKLEKHPDRSSIIKWWLQYSEDQRCFPSWYFIKETDAKYTVGYINEEDSHLYEEEYEDVFAACASFIKHELDETCELIEEDNLHKNSSDSQSQ